MKILITTDWYTPAVNGVVTSVKNLQRELERRGHEVRILTLSQSLHSWSRDGVTAIGSVNAGRIYPGARLRTAMAGRWVRELMDWRPDVIHSQCEFSTFFLARRIAEELDVPLVHTYHTVYEDYTHYFSPSVRWGRCAVAAFSRWVAAQVDGMIAPTGKVRGLLQGYGVRCPVFVVPTGIDLRRFQQEGDPMRRAVLRASLGIPAENTVLVCVGRLAEEKNIQELLKLRASLGSRPVTLLLVGDGPDRPRLEQVAHDLRLEAPAVIFAGMVPPEEVPEWYRLGDLFVSASSSETQGLTYIEALAAGVPALCRADLCLEGVILEGVPAAAGGVPGQPGDPRSAEAAGRRECGAVLRPAVCPAGGAHLSDAAGPAGGQLCPGGDRMSRGVEKTALQAASLFGLILCVLTGIWAWQAGLLTSQERLQAFVASCGAAGGLLFVAFQMVQVVVPVLPGGLGCLVGVVLFGPVMGFVYNYVGICIGSLLAFAVARNCGRPLLSLLFSEKLIAKYSDWTERNDRFARLFALAIFFPVAPDDFLCYLAGTTSMTWRRFTTIILLGKPLSIALYSLGLTVLFQQITGWLG